jgi:putative aminopeptidase FrvX
MEAACRYPCHRFRFWESSFMSLDALKDRIARYTALDAPTGFEEPVLAAARDELAKSCERVEVDVRGNVYGYQTGADPNAPLVMITAHADEIGFLVTSILPGGFLRFTKIGGPTDMVLPGQRVRVLSATGALEGVIGVKPGHVLQPGEARQVPAISDLYIDVGAESIEQAGEWGVEPGTPAVFVGELTSTRHPHRYFGKCVDNRMGVVAVLEAAERMQSQQVDASRAFVIVVEEEVGLRGAAVAASHVTPDVVIAIDTAPAGGTPDMRGDVLPWEISKGPLVKVRETRGLSTHGPLRRIIRDVAEERDIAYQLIVDTAGMTDATTAQQAGGFVAAGVIGLARRYSHSAAEMFDIRDVQAIIDLTCETTARLTSTDQLQRI